MSNANAPQDDVFTVMIVPGRTGNIRRYHLPKLWLRRGATAAGVAAVLLLLLSVDYVRVRVNLSELEKLRREAVAHREEVQTYAAQMESISAQLAKVDQLERKLRVITNLDPAEPLPLPGIGGTDGDGLTAGDVGWLSRSQRHQKMRDGLEQLADAAQTQEQSLGVLVTHLEDQTARLLHTPSIPPTRGWVTSSFGYRQSPYTGNRELHKGLDIAGRSGTPIYAAADGQIRFAGAKQALGFGVKIQHGYGVETIYGHLQEVSVKAGEAVRRGQQIGLMGSTGRSTGPHLHYMVVVNGKPVNPRNYILE